jgi:hypothetical protein
MLIFGLHLSNIAEVFIEKANNKWNYIFDYYKVLYIKSSINRENLLKKNGYNIVSIWESDFRRLYE